MLNEKANLDSFEDDYKRMILSRLNWIKFFSSAFVFVAYFLGLVGQTSFTKYVPWITATNMFSSLMLFYIIRHFKKVDALAIIYILIDMVIMYGYIYISHNPFNTLFFWSSAYVGLSYLLVGIRFSVFTLFISIFLKIFWTKNIIKNMEIPKLNIENYAGTFDFSILTFLFFITLVFYKSAKILELYKEKLKETILEIKRRSHFAAFNPGPIMTLDPLGFLEGQNHRGKSLVKSFTDEVKESVIDIGHEVLEKGFNQKLEIKCDESVYMLDMIKSEDQVIIFALDVTQIIKMRENAKLKEQHSLAIINAIPGFVSWINKDLVYEGANAQMCTFFGKDERDFVGQKVGELGGGINSEIAMFAKELFASNDNIKYKEMDFIFHGKKYYALISARKYNNNNKAVLVSIDLTDLKMAKDQIRYEQAKVEASAKLASYGEMAAGIAHEINNPLAIISGVCSSVLKLQDKDKLSSEKITDSMDKISRSIIRVTKIIRGMKALARDGEGDPIEEAKVANIIEDSLTLLVKKCFQDGIKLVTKDIPDDLYLNCQSVQISQSLVILITNSIDAILEREEKDPWIEIEVKEDEKNLVFMVTDSGNGIPQDIQEKIFQPFFTTKSVGVGTGLGLSVIVKIAQFHKGEFYIDNDCPNTRFIISIPKNL